MKTYLITLALSLSLLTGCATTPVSNDEAPNVTVDASYLRQTADSGKVTIKRDSGLNGVACSSEIFINAKPVAYLGTSEKIVVYLPADDYIIGAEAGGICGGSLTEVNATVKPGKPLTFRVGYSSNGEFSITPTAF